MSDFKPMDFGDIFNYTFRILRHNFLILYMAMGWIVVPTGLLYNYYYYTRVSAPAIGALGQEVPVIGFDHLMYMYLIMFLQIMTMQLLKPLADAGAIKIVTGVIRGEKFAPAEVFRAVFQHWNWLKLLALGVVVTVIMAMGTLALLLPALFFAVTFSLVTQVVMVEGAGVWGAVSRSWAIVLRDIGRVILVFLVMGILTYFVTSVITAPVMLLTFVLTFLGVHEGIWYLLIGMFSGFLELLVAPIPVIAMTLLYYDLRARREGIDLERRIESVI